MPFISHDKFIKGRDAVGAALLDIEDGRDLSPSFKVFVIDDGTEVELEQDITGHIMSISIELTSNLISKCSITVENRGGAFSDSGIFVPGTDIDIHLGYGDVVQKIGRWEVVRFLPQFEESGLEILTIEAYDLGYRLSKSNTEVVGASSKKPKKGKEGGKQWGTDSNPLTIGAIVEEIAAKYGAKAHLDDTTKDTDETFIQKKGTSDYEILMNIARIHGLEFFISHGVMEGEGWIISMIDPEVVFQSNVQYTFHYGGQFGTVISCSLEFALPNAPSEIKAWVYDPSNAKWAEIFEEETKEGKKQKRQFKKGYFAEPWNKDVITGDPDDADQFVDMVKFKLQVEGYSVDVLTKPFKSQDAAKAYLAKWFNERKNSFIVAKVRIPGVENLRPNQKHQIAGIGSRFSGTYYVTDVFHTFDENGFFTEFECRKSVQPVTSNEAALYGKGDFAPEAE